MAAVVGSPCQFVAGGETMAAIIVMVHKPTEVSVVKWSNTGIMSVSQTVEFVVPGKAPPPNSPYVIPLPGGPTATPTGP